MIDVRDALVKTTQDAQAMVRELRELIRDRDAKIKEVRHNRDNWMLAAIVLAVAFGFLIMIMVFR
jgi:hypothetical protein